MSSTDEPALADRTGTLVIGRPWDDGQLPEREAAIEVHVFAGRDQQGLGTASCGLRQEHRSNGWAFFDPANDYQVEMIGNGTWPWCVECLRRAD